MGLLDDQPDRHCCGIEYPYVTADKNYEQRRKAANECGGGIIQGIQPDRLYAHV